MIREDSTTANEPRASERLILVQHWVEELKRLVPKMITAYVKHSLPRRD